MKLKHFFIIFLSLNSNLILAKNLNLDCGNNPQARALAKLIMEDPTQLRSHLSCDSRLTQAAIVKVNEMAESGWVMHIGANGRVRDTEFPLPDYYGIGMANQVEALAAGQPSADTVWSSFKKSESHANHLLGKLRFYHEQNKFGVAFLNDDTSKHGQYWAIYMAKESLINQKNIDLGPIPSKGPEGVIFEDTERLDIKINQ